MSTESNICDPVTIKLSDVQNADYTVERIYKYFQERKIGNVDSIDIICNPLRKCYKVIFTKWNPFDDGARIRQKLQKGLHENFFIDGKLFQGEFTNFIREKPKKITYKNPY